MTEHEMGHETTMSTRSIILVVDDDPFVRSMLEDLLITKQYSVFTAKNGRDALEKYIRLNDIELIISDMNMSEMNGLGLIKEIRKLDEDLPIIILTVNNELQVALEAIRSGANDYIIKDENILDTLLISAESAIKTYRLKKENILLLKELQNKNRELERQSTLDGLTGIPNRRQFDRVVAGEWGRAIRDGRPISIIMIDIDCFKDYNDTFGHLLGDDCLKAVAAGLTKVLKRDSDCLFRYGGEEFAAILPATDVQGAAIVAEEMRRTIVDENISHPTSIVMDRVSISIGVAGMVPRDNIDFSTLISLADKALYAAKDAGRNQVVVSRK